MKASLITGCADRVLRADLFTPFTISTGSHKNLENALFSVKSKDGFTGWGEAAVASHITGETLRGTRQGLVMAANYLEGKDSADYLKLFCALEEMLDSRRAALTAVQTAMLDLATRRLGISLWQYFGGAEPRLKTDVTVVIGGAAAARGFTFKMRRRGFKIFKIKVGIDFDEDIRRLEAVRESAPGCDIYLDANGAYTLREAGKFIRVLEKRGIVPAVFEQPVAKDDFEGLASLSKKLKMPVCADESAYSVNDVFRLLAAKAVTAVNIKLAKFGFIKAREVWTLAKAKGVKLMMGEMLESELASGVSAQFAGGLGGFDFIDLDTPFFIKGSGMRGAGFISRGGVYSLDKIKAGTGVVPDLRR